MIAYTLVSDRKITVKQQKSLHSLYQNSLQNLYQQPRGNATTDADKCQDEGGGGLEEEEGHTHDFCKQSLHKNGPDLTLNPLRCCCCCKGALSHFGIQDRESSHGASERSAHACHGAAAAQMQMQSELYNMKCDISRIMDHFGITRAASASPPFLPPWAGMDRSLSARAASPPGRGGDEHDAAASAYHTRDAMVESSETISPAAMDTGGYHSS